MKRWIITQKPNGIVLHRPGRSRLDFAVEARLEARSTARLAHQIRQDLWRGLQNLRGFSPVVEISGEVIRAGGQVDGPIPPKAVETAQAILACPKNRRRWERCS